MPEQQMSPDATWKAGQAGAASHQVARPRAASPQAGTGTLLPAGPRRSGQQGKASFC